MSGSLTSITWCFIVIGYCLIVFLLLSHRLCYCRIVFVFLSYRLYVIVGELNIDNLVSYYLFLLSCLIVFVLLSYRLCVIVLSVCLFVRLLR